MKKIEYDNGIDFESGLKPEDIVIESPAEHAKRMEELSKRFDIQTVSEILPEESKLISSYEAAIKRYKTDPKIKDIDYASDEKGGVNSGLPKEDGTNIDPTLVNVPKSEEVDKVELEEDTETEKRISDISSFEDLFDFIDGIDGLSGSSKFFSRDDIKKRVELFIEGKSDDTLLTSNFGFRDKVADLLRQENERYNKFSKDLLLIDSGLHLVGTELWKRDIVNRMYVNQMGKSKKINIYKNNIYFGSVILSGSDENEFFDQVVKLYVSKTADVKKTNNQDTDDLKPGQEFNERSESLSDIGLTKLEVHQAEKRVTDIADEKRRISFFQENPEARKSLIANPFSGTNGENFKDVPGGDNEYTLLRSAVLAEQDGKYEQDFIKLPKDERLKRIYSQIEQSAEITIRIQDYVEKNLSNIGEISDGELYEALRDTVFGKKSDNKIQAEHPLSQRRSFRLSIANFLEERNNLEDYRLEASSDPKEFANKYLKRKFNGDVTIEQLPVGFIIYLDENDYALVQTTDNDPKSISSAGVTLFGKYLPKNLQGKIVLLNRGGKETDEKTKEDLLDTRTHEVRHILFSMFHEQQESLYIKDTRALLGSCKTEKDFQSLSRRVSDSFTERAKDEIIAYFSGGDFDESLTDLGFDSYKWHIEEVNKALDKRKDLDEETKKSILDGFIKDRVKSFETIKRMRFVAERLYRQPGNGIVQNVLAKLGIKEFDTEHKNNISEALLRNTQGSKIHRLSRYIGLSDEEVKSDRFIKEKDSVLVKELNDIPDIPEYFDGDWWDKTLEILNRTKELMPPEVMSILLKHLPKWIERTWGGMFVEKSLSLIEGHINIYGCSEEDKQNIKKLVSDFVLENGENENLKESVNKAVIFLKNLN